MKGEAVVGGMHVVWHRWRVRGLAPGIKSSREGPEHDPKALSSPLLLLITVFGCSELNLHSCNRQLS